jgi:hypothetical protein
MYSEPTIERNVFSNVLDIELQRTRIMNRGSSVRRFAKLDTHDGLIMRP